MEVKQSTPKILRLRAVIEITGLSKSTIYQRAKNGTFPQRKLLGANSVGWLQVDVENWINSCTEPKA